MTLSSSIAAVTLLAFALGLDEVRSEPDKKPFTITTRAGKEYTNVKVRRVRPDAVVFFHDKGAATIPLHYLTPELQEHFCYEPEKAAESAKAEAAKQWAIRQRLAADRAAFYAGEVDRIKRWEDQQTRIKIAQWESYATIYAASLQASQQAAAADETRRDSYSGNDYDYRDRDRGYYSNSYRRSNNSNFDRRRDRTPTNIDRRRSSQQTICRPSSSQGAKVSTPTFSGSARGNR